MNCYFCHQNGEEEHPAVAVAPQVTDDPSGIPQYFPVCSWHLAGWYDGDDPVTLRWPYFRMATGILPRPGDDEVY